MHAAKNYRVWILFGAYAACFGIEIFIHNIVAMYYVDHFKFGLKEAGMAAGIFRFTGIVRSCSGWHCQTKLQQKGA